MNHEPHAETIHSLVVSKVGDAGMQLQPPELGPLRGEGVVRQRHDLQSTSVRDSVRRSAGSGHRRRVSKESRFASRRIQTLAVPITFASNLRTPRQPLARVREVSVQRRVGGEQCCSPEHLTGRMLARTWVYWILQREVGCEGRRRGCKQKKVSALKNASQWPESLLYAQERALQAYLLCATSALFLPGCRPGITTEGGNSITIADAVSADCDFDGKRFNAKVDMINGADAHINRNRDTTEIANAKDKQKNERAYITSTYGDLDTREIFIDERPDEANVSQSIAAIVPCCRKGDAKCCNLYLREKIDVCSKRGRPGETSRDFALDTKAIRRLDSFPPCCGNPYRGEITLGKRTGTGFVVSSQKILTSSHVLYQRRAMTMCAIFDWQRPSNTDERRVHMDQSQKHARPAVYDSSLPGRYCSVENHSLTFPDAFVHRHPRGQAHQRDGPAAAQWLSLIHI